MTDRRIAYDILARVTEDGAYANLALKDGLAGMPRERAAAVTALVYTTIERLNHADLLIAHYARGRVQRGIRLILRMGIAELLYMRTPAYAVCSGSVELARSIGKPALSGYVNAVLRNVLRDAARNSLPRLPDGAAERMHILYGVPVFLAEEYIELGGEAFAEELLSAETHSITLRAQWPFTAEELGEYLDSKGIPYRRGRLVPDAFVIEKGFDTASDPAFSEGRMTVQSESAMLACRACGAEPGMRVLDACAAPGGKSAYLSSLTGGQCRITAWDVHPHRVELMKRTFERLGVRADAALHDAAEPLPELEGTMDVVLADAPCSGLGGGSKPDACLNRTEKDIAELAALQRRILDVCCKYVKPGGTLVYSTCTVSKRENDDNVLAFLDGHREFSAEWPSGLLPAALEKRAAGGMLRLFPNLDGTDGFFIVRMKRKQADGN